MHGWPAREQPIYNLDVKCDPWSSRAWRCSRWWRRARPAAAQQPPAGEPHDAAAAQASPDAREYPTLHIAGFGDVNFASTKRPEGPHGFSLGQFVLHMTSELSPHVTFFGEISFTARSDAGTGSPPAPGFNSEIERMIIRFDRNDQLKVSFGRYHTPINWWNTAFHHGQWLQTTIARPEMTQFGGRFIPCTSSVRSSKGRFPPAAGTSTTRAA